MPDECATCAAARAAVNPETASLLDYTRVLCQSCLRELAAIEMRLPADVAPGAFTVGTVLAAIRTAARAELERRARQAGA